MRGDDRLLKAGQEPLALGQRQTQSGQGGEVVGLGNPEDVGAVLPPPLQCSPISRSRPRRLYLNGKIALKILPLVWPPNLATVPNRMAYVFRCIQQSRAFTQQTKVVVASRRDIRCFY